MLVWKVRFPAKIATFSQHACKIYDHFTKTKKIKFIMYAIISKSLILLALFVKYLNYFSGFFKIYFMFQGGNNNFLTGLRH